MHRTPDRPDRQLSSDLTAHMQSLSAAEQKKSRRMIWELRVSQCSIIGTCCTMSDLQRLSRKFLAVKANQTYSDYELHTLVVREMESNNPFSRAVQKLLDERFKGLIRKVARLTEAHEYRSLWRESVRSGLAPGAYWALLTSSTLPDDLMVEIFGEVHMLSHLCGSSHREDIRELSVKLAEQQSEIAHLRTNHDRALTALRKQQALVSELRARNAFLHQKVAQVDYANRAPTCKEESRPRVATRQSDKLAAAFTRLEEENASLRRVLQNIPCKQSADAAEGAVERICDLGGRRVLYVGGVRNAVCKIREVAEGRGGCFLHHDGGLEQSLNELEGLTSRADIVFVPVRHVSHQAALRAKALCTSQRIPFCALRSSSVSAFAEALSGISLRSAAVSG